MPARERGPEPGRVAPCRSRSSSRCSSAPWTSGRAVYQYNGVAEAARELARDDQRPSGRDGLGSSPETTAVIAAQQVLVPALVGGLLPCVDIAGAAVAGTCHPGSWVRVTLTSTLRTRPAAPARRSRRSTSPRPAAPRSSDREDRAMPESPARRDASGQILVVFALSAHRPDRVRRARPRRRLDVRPAARPADGGRPGRPGGANDYLISGSRQQAIDAGADRGRDERVRPRRRRDDRRRERSTPPTASPSRSRSRRSTRTPSSGIVGMPTWTDRRGRHRAGRLPRHGARRLAVHLLGRGVQRRRHAAVPDADRLRRDERRRADQRARPRLDELRDRQREHERGERDHRRAASSSTRR